MIRRAVNGVLDAQGWADGLGELLQKIYLAVLRPIPLVKDFLHGTWLGHALHPVITDVPVGALTAALFLDIIGQAEGARWAMLLGYAGLIGAALTGVADFTGTYDKVRRYATIHSLLMVISTVGYLVSLLIRFGVVGGSHEAAVAIAVFSYVILAIGAYIGGELVYDLGYMVDRHAWRTGGTKWAALEPATYPENELAKGKAGTQSIVVVRRGETIYALHDTCAHAGCSLAEMGKLVDDKIECKCHGSRFDLRTGHVARGPATFDQPAYEIRRAEGRLEGRRRGA